MQAALERRRKRIERLQQKERIKQEEEEKSRELQANAGSASVPDPMMGVAAWPYGAAGMGWPPTMIPSWPSAGGDFGIPAYNPATPSIAPQPPTFSASPPAPPVSTAWMPFLGSFAPTPYEPAATNEPMGWSATLPPHVGAFPPQAGPAPAILPPTDAAGSGQADDQRQSEQLDVDNKSTGSSPPFDLFALLRSPSPGAHPFSAALNQPILDNLALPGSTEASSSLDLQMVATKAVDADRLALAAFNDAVAQAQVTPQPDQPLPVAVNQAASFLASADFAFTQSYLLSHYTTSLARLVSLASAPSSDSSSSRPSSSSDRSQSRSRTSRERERTAATAKSARASANLYLSLVPLAHRHTFLLHAILSWSAANLAAASAARQQGAEAPVPGQPPAGGGNNVMASLSDQLGHLADQGLVAALPALEAYAAARAERSADQSMSDETRREKDLEEVPHNWEAMLAARLMLTHTAICQGAVDLWRTRMREAAQIINLVGGVRQCRSPLARQLVKNLLYHDVLSSSSRNDGLLVDYSALRTRDSARDGGSAKTSPASATPGEGDSEQDRLDEEDEEDVLDTLMGAAEAVFLLIARITSLAKEKRQALKTSGGTIAEDDLSTYMRKVEEIKYELEREKDRMDAFLVERPDLEPHRYFHEVFRLAALLYLEMLLELPPTSYPILLLVRKMLSLTEVIVSESLPGPAIVGSVALNYGASCFEGLKAFRHEDGQVKLFRPQENAARMNYSAAAISMPEIPEEMFLEACHKAVAKNLHLVPPHAPHGSAGSMYLRPLYFASGPQLALVAPNEFTFIVYVTQTGSLYGTAGGKAPAVDAFVIEDFDRAAPQGTGTYKLAGNYGPALRHMAQAKKNGYPITLHLDSKTRTFVDEFSTSNFAAFKKASSPVSTPTLVVPKSESILRSVTTKSLMDIAKSFGWNIEHRPLKFQEVVDGTLEEVFACGTAAAITPVRSITYTAPGGELKKVSLGDGQNAGPNTLKLLAELTGIQAGNREDKFGWTWPSEGVDASKA
uniref:FGENESH: predicted gene_6.325 protein n=1 Tax=Rhodotorula toruloides TaxID=5286 RepID=A0A0K3CG41_RHOTO